MTKLPTKVILRKVNNQIINVVHLGTRSRRLFVIIDHLHVYQEVFVIYN